MVSTVDDVPKGLANAGHMLRRGLSVVVSFMSFVKAPSGVRPCRDDKPVLAMVVGGHPVETRRGLRLTRASAGMLHSAPNIQRALDTSGPDLA